MKLDILAIGVHPDDVELGCAGTLLKHVDMGYKVGIVDLTAGEMGTRGNAQLRMEEAESSKNMIGALIRDNLGMADAFFEHNEINILKISHVIRKYQPEIVLANAHSDRHPDHGRASKLISDACFYSGLQKVIQKDDSGKKLPAWRPKVVYHYIQDRNIKADFVVDITPYMEKKIECILAFKSQFYNPDSTELNTPISGLDFIEYNRAKNRAYGRDIRADYAEGFTVDRNMGVKDLFDIV